MVLGELTATLCNETEMNLRAFLGLLTPLKKSGEQPTETPKNLLYRHDNVEAKILIAESNKLAWQPTRPHPWDCTSRHRLPRRWPQRHRPRACRLFAFFLVGWLGTGIRRWRSTWRGAKTSARHRTWPARRWHRLGASETPSTHVTNLRLGYRLPPRLEALGARILSPTSAQCTGAVGGSLACRTPENSMVSTSACSSKRSCGRAAGSQLLPPVQERNSWNRWQMVTAHPSERAWAAWQNWRVRHQCITGSGTPSVSVSRLTGSQGNSRQTKAPLPFSYTQPAQHMEEALKQLLRQ